MNRLVGALGWLGVALVVVAVVLRFSRPELGAWYQPLAIAGFVVTLLYSLTQWRDIRRSFQGRGARYGFIALSGTVLVLAILVGLNWISTRQNKRWDVTAGGQFSLSDQTKKLLAGLTQPVTVQVFYQDSPEEYRDRLAEYSYYSKQLKPNFVDVRRSPTEAQKYGITTVPTFVIEYAGRQEKTNASDEQSLTNALKKVIEGQAKKVYFVQGHGEENPTGSDPPGYSQMTDALKTDNFEVAPLTLAQTGKVPDDATLLVVAGPRTDLLGPELDAVKAYLAKGGKLALLLNPPDKGTAPDTPGLIALAHDWGVDVGNDLVVDASGIGQLIGTDASVPIAMPAQHPITENFRLMTAFPLARSTTPVDGGVNGHVAQKVLETSEQSWAESDVKGLYATGRPKKDPQDKPGPVTIGAAVSAPVAAAPGASADAPKPETRVVIVGDSNFGANSWIKIPGNRDLFLNMANWLAQQEDLIAIRPKSAEDRPITMTADQGRMVWIFTMLVVPGLLLANAARVWWKRR